MLHRILYTTAEEEQNSRQCYVNLLTNELHRRITVGMIFAVRQLQEKCFEQSMDLYSVFIDLTNAFDTVDREVLWKIKSNQIK